MQEDRIKKAEEMVAKMFTRPAILDGNGLNCGDLPHVWPFSPIDPVQVDVAVLWLRTKTKTRRYNPYRVTYGIKNDCQREMGEYVSNGALIVALLTEGWKITPLPRSYSVRTNIGGLK